MSTMVSEELIGRVCVKLKGRDAGLKGVVVAAHDRGYVTLTGPKTLTGLRRRKVNVQHILPTLRSVKISPNASDDEVLKAIKEAGLESYMVERHEF
jgi:large subunit ribosomal protein L14e